MDLRRAVAIAAVLHAAVFLGLWRLPRSPSAGSGAEASTPRPPDVAREWEVALESALEPASLAPEPAVRAERVAGASSRLPLASARELGAISRSRSDDARLADAPESVPAPAWTFSPITPPPPDLALPSSSEQARAARADPSSGRGLEGVGAGTGAAPGAAGGPGSDRTSNVLRDALHAADVAKGVEIGVPFLPGIKTSNGSKDPARVDIMVTPDGDVSIGTNLDPTDIGTRPLRTVTTRIVGETLL